MGYLCVHMHVQQHCAQTAAAMVSKCANPKCQKSLVRMDGGKIFGFHTTTKRIEHFWLCARCSKQFTLRHIEGHKVEVVRKLRKSA